MLVNATSIDFVICAAPTTTAERPQTTVLFFRGLLVAHEHRRAQRQRADQRAHVAIVRAQAAERRGLADRLGPASYDVTEAGRAFLAALPVDQVVKPKPARQLLLFDE